MNDCTRRPGADAARLAKDISFVTARSIVPLAGMNAEFIHMALPQGDRLRRLNAIAIRQMQTLTASSGLRPLEPPKGRQE